MKSMKRKSFIFSFAPLFSFIFWPIKFITSRIDKGVKVDEGQDRYGKPLSLLEGDTFFTKVSTADSNGELYIFESTRVKKGGVGLHLHYEQDEWWYILEGEFLFKVGDETFTAKKGDSVFGPRNVPHAFSKTSDGIAKMLITFQPAGRMEEHFKAVSEGIYSKLTDEEKTIFRHKNGMKAVGPALGYDKTK
jgi:mannose-6-phosphate isomerase-like protein (cupin superfamily)